MKQFRRLKPLLRQPRVKKDSESTTPTEQDPGTSSLIGASTLRKSPRPMSEPSPGKAHPPPELLMIRKQVSTPTPAIITSEDGKISGAVAPILLSSVMLSTEEIKCEGAVAAPTRDEANSSANEAVVPAISTSEQSVEYSEPTPDIYESLRSSHCPAIRNGPALSCNFCWNTIDDHGRILRRKTKYHCPECQTNLCIVPCFQVYHERHPH